MVDRTARKNAELVPVLGGRVQFAEFRFIIVFRDCLNFNACPLRTFSKNWRVLGALVNFWRHSEKVRR
jgi:hypothetical protein